MCHLDSTSGLSVELIKALSSARRSQEEYSRVRSLRALSDCRKMTNVFTKECVGVQPRGKERLDDLENETVTTGTPKYGRFENYNTTDPRRHERRDPQNVAPLFGAESAHKNPQRTP